MRAWIPWLIVVLEAFSVMPVTADFRDPQGKPFTVWPNIPFVQASDFEEYALDRSIFKNLHEDAGDPAAIVAALEAVDELQQHHQQRALGEIGRSFNTELIAKLDALKRSASIAQPKLKFSFAGIAPDELQRPLEMDEPELDALEAKAAEIALVGYATYTQLPNNELSVTLTLVKLKTGAAESFSVTANVGRVSEKLAKVLFDYFYGYRFPAANATLPDKQWLAAAPGHQGQPVSYVAARTYCQSQNARLPTAIELEAGRAAGPYHGGIRLKSYARYHLQEGLYASTSRQDPRGSVRPRLGPHVNSANYYCIRSN